MNYLISELCPQGKLIINYKVDRLLSLWQALYPNIWVTPGSSEDGSFTIESGQTVNNNSNLTPFHSDDANFVNSETCRSVNKFGYTYPEINLPFASPEELKDHVTKAVLELYGPDSVFDSNAVAATQSLASGKTPIERRSLSSESNPSNREFLLYEATSHWEYNY